MKTYGVLSLFCGLGGNALGFLRARSPSGSRFESVGAFDIDPDACRDFATLTGAPAQAVDITELEPADLAARCTRRPDVVFLSAPCKGSSSCLPEALAAEQRYLDMNMLGLRGLDLALEAWPVKPSIILFENVPRIRTRAPQLIEQVTVLLRAAGYVVDMRTHDCGQLGGLAQRRERFLLVARHEEQAPSFLQKPPVQPLRPMSEVLWPLPVPVPTLDGPKPGGELHRLPQLSGLNWLRLAAIPAGRDWKWIPGQIRLSSRKGRHNGAHGVNDPEGPSHTIVGEAEVRNTWSSVADPRLAERSNRHAGIHGVHDPSLPSRTVIGECREGKGWAGVSDPRIHTPRYNASFEVQASDGVGRTVIGASTIGHGYSITDPRLGHTCRRGSLGVADPAKPAITVIAHASRSHGQNVADPREGFVPTAWLTTAAKPTDRAAWVGARFDLESETELKLGAKGRPTHTIILAPDGTIHRPLTTLELAVLQGIPAWHRPGDPTELELDDPSGQWLDLAGKADGDWRSRIGNAVPVGAATAIANEVLAVLEAGTTVRFSLSTGGTWVDQASAEIGAEAR